ncbi:hypothetical protein F2Q69_00006920 [Brassica cretica]|uniref:Uncharacterized protein n=1 Tax=Brassica cretica TaxID=69181 RepID=A0A8S9P0P7_BRACR|nr:hypothetical protein F2Q69_00006920 [Brassica cretica]
MYTCGQFQTLCIGPKITPARRSHLKGGKKEGAINRVRTPFERFKTGLVKVYGKVNSLVKGQPESGESRRPASASHGGPVAFRQRRSSDSATVWRRRRTAAKAAETISGGGAWPSRACEGETLNAACGFIRTPIAAWSVATASSRREEYDDGFACARFSTVEKTKLGGVFIDKHLGPRVIAVAKSSNLVLMVLDASKILTKELEAVGSSLNKRPPQEKEEKPWMNVA